MKEYHAKWYATNRERRLAQMRERKQQNKARIVALKESTPCFDCGEHYPFYVMDYDHTEDNKKAGIAGMLNYKWEIIQAEIAKCELVCANCHRKRTYLRLGDRALINMGA